MDSKNDKYVIGKEYKIKSILDLGFTRLGHIFRGWSRDGSSELIEDEATLTIDDSSTELTANWEEDPVEVWLDRNYEEEFLTSSNGRVKQPNTLRNVPFNILKNPFERSGYKFLGWNVDPNAKSAQYLDEDQVTPTENMVLYAIWGVNTYTVRFLNDDDSVITTQQVTYGGSAVAPQNSPDKIGYDFNGWNKDFTNITSDLDIKPTWMEYDYLVDDQDNPIVDNNDSAIEVLK